CFFFQAEDGIRDGHVTGVQTCALPICVVAHEDIPRYLATMGVAVAPYPAIGNFYYSPLKLFEYMAAARAVVASRTGQVAQVINRSEERRVGKESRRRWGREESRRRNEM